MSSQGQETMSTTLDAPATGATFDSTPAGDAQSREWTAHHPVNIRLSIPFVGGRYYLTIVGGKERRSAERLAEEREKHPLMTLGNVTFMATAGTVAGFAVMMLLQKATLLFWENSGVISP